MGCQTPSSSIDGGDLLGVFAHDAGPAAAGRGAAPRGAAASSEAPPMQIEAPPDGGASGPKPPAATTACVAEEGATLDRSLRRTLGRPGCRGAEILEWKDAEGSPRYACVFSPPGAETRAPLPLVIFFHDPEDDPTAVDKKTGLRKLGASFNLSGDPSHAGFIVLAPAGRALKRTKTGAVFDAEYTGGDNVDVAAVEHFTAELEARGIVDRRRIYAMGQASGGQMAATLAMLRPDRIAAFATYATDAPLAAWACPGPPPPGIIVYRACDGFVSCASVERWLRAREGAGADTAWLRLGDGVEEEPNCAFKNKCTPRKSEGNHRRWPKGREATMLAFFARQAAR
jgi:poly(3-hydroxybutyrate) depolymerase